MTASKTSVKEALKLLAEQLPDDATWHDVAYEVRVRQEIEQGLAEAERGEFVSADALRLAFARWRVQLSAD